MSDHVKADEAQQAGKDLLERFCVDRVSDFCSERCKQHTGNRNGEQGRNTNVAQVNRPGRQTRYVPTADDVADGAEERDRETESSTGCHGILHFDVAPNHPRYRDKAAPCADCHPDAAEGFTGQTRRHLLEVSCPEELWAAVPQADRDALRGVLANDPRPSYQHDPARVYGMEFGGLEVHFTVDDPVLTVRDITRR